MTILAGPYSDANRTEKGIWREQAIKQAAKVAGLKFIPPNECKDVPAGQRKMDGLILDSVYGIPVSVESKNDFPNSQAVFSGTNLDRVPVKAKGSPMIQRSSKPVIVTTDLTQVSYTLDYFFKMSSIYIPLYLPKPTHPGNFKDHVQRIAEFLTEFFKALRWNLLPLTVVVLIWLLLHMFSAVCYPMITGLGIVLSASRRKHMKKHDRIYRFLIHRQKSEIDREIAKLQLDYEMAQMLGRASTSLECQIQLLETIMNFLDELLDQIPIGDTRKKTGNDCKKR